MKAHQHSGTGADRLQGNAWALFVLALAVRLAFCWLAYPHLENRFGPGDDYDQIALSVLAGDGYRLAGEDARPERLPLMVLFLGAHFWLFGSRSWPWQISQSVLGALTCVMVYRLGQRLGSRRSAWLAAVFCVVHPTLLLYTARPMTETLYTFLLMGFLSTLAVGRPVCAGVSLGLQWLTKSTAVLQLPVVLLLPGRGRWLASCVTLAVVLPWAAMNVLQLEAPWLFTATGGRALYHGLFISRHVTWLTPTADLNRDAELALRGELAKRGVAATASIRERDRLAGELARQSIRSQPLAYARLTLRNLALTWYLGRSRGSMAVHALLHGGLLLAAALGAWRAWRYQPAERRWVLGALGLIIVYTTFHAAVQPAVRYILPVVPCAAVLAAAAFLRRSRI